MDLNNNNNNGNSNIKSQQQLDTEFQQLGCLGHGGFGSVFLAQKQSGRKVALKFVYPRNTRSSESSSSDTSMMDDFLREAQVLKRLTTSQSHHDDKRTLGVVHFEEWFQGPDYACMVLGYADGGILSDEIRSQETAPYTERRIAWYILQLCDALSFCHERQIAHHDVKSSNVLIDVSKGGQLLLADFDKTVSPTELPRGFTKSYASPELQHAYHNDSFEGLAADKIDSFGLGCIVFELLCRKVLEGNEGPTLAEYLVQNGVDQVLALPLIRLPWKNESTPDTTVCYSKALQNLTKKLLLPDPNERWTPSKLVKPLRLEQESPLLCATSAASHLLVPGQQVSVDNIQLGMFVQRGQDWSDGFDDGGPGAIGTIINLDADAGYTEVAWPTTRGMFCRIGARQKFELQVGPTDLLDFSQRGTTTALRSNGILCNVSSAYTVGQQLDSRWTVVSVDTNRNVTFIAPTERRSIASTATHPVGPRPVPTALTRPPMPRPSNWIESNNAFVEVTDANERSNVLDVFYEPSGGLDMVLYEVTSIQRFQSPYFWSAWSTKREEVAAENWGIANERQLFFGTQAAPATKITDGTLFQDSVYAIVDGGLNLPLQAVMLSKESLHAHCNVPSRLPVGERQVVLARVVLGRLRSGEHLTHCHSVKIASYGAGYSLYSLRSPLQAYPEYVITYKPHELPQRRIVRAARPSRFHERPRSSPSTARGSPLRLGASPVAARLPSAPSTPTQPTKTGEQLLKEHKSPSKLCVVCQENPVSRVIIPCGHPCLCPNCSTRQGIRRLKNKCPECRGQIVEVVTIYGRVVND